MSLTEISVRRPVTVAMFFIGIALVGAISFNQLSVDFLPAVKVPELIVQTIYPDASAEEVERSVTEPIEWSLATVSGVKRITSISRDGISLVRVQFYWGTNIEYALLEVREKLDAIRATLPTEAQRPTILRIDPSAESIIIIAVSLKNRTEGENLGEVLSELKMFSQELLKKRFEQIEGVAQAVVAGGMEREIKVSINPDKLKSFGLNILDVAEAIKNSNISFAGGTLRMGTFRYPFRLMSEFRNLEDIKSVAIKTPSGKNIKLSDIADVRWSFAERSGLTRLNGKEAILIFIKKEAGTNTVKVSEKVHSVVRQLSSEYSDVNIEIIFDQAEFIKKAISDIQQAIFWGALFAFLSLFIFLRNPKYPLIIGIVTPFAILLTIAGMYLLGINFNIISLTGLALGIGMIGDNAVIIVENYSRLRAKGLNPLEAVLASAKEINIAVSAATFTNVAIFLPIVLIKGVAQKLFVDMGVTMTLSLISSLVVAVTLVPSLLSRMKEKEIPGTGKGFVKILNIYEKFLKWSLENKKTTIAISLVLTIISLGFAFAIKTEQFPDIDQSRFRIEIELPQGSSLELTSRISETIEKELMEMREISKVVADVGISSTEDYFSAIFSGLNRAKIDVKINENFKLKDVIEKVREKLESGGIYELVSRFGGNIAVKSRATTFERILRPSESDIEVKISRTVKGKTAEMGIEREFAERVADEMKKINGLTDIGIFPEMGAPELKIIPDEDKLSLYGISKSTIAEEISSLVKGKIATYLVSFGRRTPVRVTLENPNSRDPVEGILNYGVNHAGKFLPLHSIAYVERTLGISEIFRENGNRVILIRANLVGKNILSAVDELNSTIEKINPPQGIKAFIGGEIEEIKESFTSLIIIILLSVFLVYVILASEYESPLYPLVILLTSPFALVGSFIFMFIGGQSYNVMSIVGLVIMLGAIDNDAVIALDLIISNRRSGMNLLDAIIDGMRKRFRPIVMTTLTTILGIIPLVIGFGKGLEFAVALSYPIIGGLLASTFFTLFVIPVVYTFFDRLSVRNE